ncbi:MAG: NADH-ubiquinone oxidoreductase, partial [Thermodesulfobacteriota bacterium]
GLEAPAAWPAALSAALLYAAHHALAKGALFLGVGVVQRVRGKWQLWAVVAGLLFPALALAGAPLTSGAVAKLALKDTLALPLPPWPGWLEGVLSLAAVGTTLLMGRFFFLVWPTTHTHGPRLAPGLWLPWAVLLLGVLVVTWLFVPARHGEVVRKTLSFAVSWPVCVGALLAVAAWRYGQQWALLSTLRIPSGDVLITVDWLMSWGQRGWHSFLAPLVAGKPMAWVAQHRSSWRMTEIVIRVEGRLGRWANAGLLFLLLAGVFLATFVLAYGNKGR